MSCPRCDLQVGAGASESGSATAGVVAPAVPQREPRRDDAMKLRLLALDYDGTIAAEGTLDPAVEAALRRVTQPDSHANPCSESNAQATTLVP